VKNELNSEYGEMQHKKKKEKKKGRAMETRGLFWKFFVMGTEGNKDENLGNCRIFSDPNNGYL
jgi:hypothetical protein